MIGERKEQWREEKKKQKKGKISSHHPYFLAVQDTSALGQHRHLQRALLEVQA